MEIKDRIARALAIGSLTQAQLAKQLGVTRSAVSQWVTGSTIPDTRRIEQIAAETGVRKEWLAYGAEPSVDSEQAAWLRFQSQSNDEKGEVPKQSAKLRKRALRLFGARVAQSLVAHNIADDDAAKSIGLSRWNFERLKWEGTPLGSDQIAHLASVLKVNKEWLQNGGDGGPSEAFDIYTKMVETGDIQALQDEKREEVRRLPKWEEERVLEMHAGLFRGREYGTLMVETPDLFEDALTDDCAKWGPIAKPAFLTDAPHAYAFEMWHERLEPALKQSCIAYVWPGRTVKEGDEVMVRFKDGRRMPYVYGGVGEDWDTHILKELSPASNVQFKMTEIESFSLIVLAMRVRM